MRLMNKSRVNEIKKDYKIISKKYKDTKYVTKFNFFVDEDEIRRILNIFASAIKEWNKTINNERNK